MNTTISENQYEAIVAELQTMSMDERAEYIAMFEASVQPLITQMLNRLGDGE